MPNARVGSISTGTLLTADLVSAFVAELDYLTSDTFTTRPKEIRALSEAARKWLASEPDDDDEHGGEYEYEGEGILEDLRSALEEIAPPYCYFGTLEGDGADFGFWPSRESIDELPRISDPSMHPVQLADYIADAAKRGDWQELRELADHLASSEAIGEDCAFVNDHGNVTVYGADGSVLLEIV